MEAKFEALKHLGAGEFEHLNGSLIAHLKGTRDLLNRWEADLVLCDAGLFHAAYGTAGFDESMVSLDQRNKIAGIIGEEAESLVYLYCSSDREFVNSKLNNKNAIQFRDRFTGQEFILTDTQAKAFCELTVANEMELVFLSDEFKAKYGSELFELFENMQNFLSDIAISTYKSELANVA